MERVAFIMRVREGEEEEYRRRHREVWPAVLADLERAGGRSMSIFMADLQLFLYMEVEEYAAAVRVLAESSESVRREEYMAPILKGCRRCSIGGLPVEGTTDSMCFAQGSVLC